jgi:membrane protein implicated in regulation of membrane protease activity
MFVAVPALEAIVMLIALVIAAVTVRVVAIAMVFAAWLGHRGRRGQQRQSDNRCDTRLEHKSSLITRRCKHLGRHSRGRGVTQS